MKNVGLHLLLMAVLLSGCTKQQGPLRPHNISEGLVQFTFKVGPGLRQCLLAVKGSGANNYELRNFYYTKTIPGDSMSYYFILFKGCSYIKSFDIFKKPEDNFTRFRSFYFQNLTLADEARWDSLVKRENITEMPDAGEGLHRSGIIYVDPGQEKTWINKLESLPEILSADYVYIRTGEF